MTKYQLCTSRAIWPLHAHICHLVAWVAASCSGVQSSVLNGTVLHSRVYILSKKCHDTALRRGGDSAYSRAPRASFIVVETQWLFKRLSQGAFKNRITFLFLQAVLLSQIHCSSLLPCLGWFCSSRGFYCLASILGDRGWDGAWGVDEEICQWTFLGDNYFLSKRFVALFLGSQNVLMSKWPLHSSHIKVLLASKWLCQSCVSKLTIIKQPASKMAVPYTGRGLAI